jgi:uncharacterized protein (DUF4415 family)
MKKLTARQRQKQLDSLAAIPDRRIDLSDIPELTMQQLRQAVRGQMYRPIKKPVTMRLDMDIIEWLKQDGPGYQSKANSLLRREMVRALRMRKGAARVANGRTANARRKAKPTRAR